MLDDWLEWVCGHDRGNEVASRVLDHGLTRSGGAKRRSPRGGSAKGMPKNCRTFGNLESTVPCTLPVLVRTVSESCWWQADPARVLATKMPRAIQRRSIVAREVQRTGHWLYSVVNESWKVEPRKQMCRPASLMTLLPSLWAMTLVGAT